MAEVEETDWFTVHLHVTDTTIKRHAHHFAGCL